MEHEWIHFFPNETKPKFETGIRIRFHLLIKYEDLNPIFYKMKWWKKTKFRRNLVKTRNLDEILLKIQLFLLTTYRLFKLTDL